MSLSHVPLNPAGERICCISKHDELNQMHMHFSVCLGPSFIPSAEFMVSYLMLHVVLFLEVSGMFLLC